MDVKRVKRAVLWFLLLTLAIGLCEATLSLTRVVSSRVDFLLSDPYSRRIIPDSELGSRFSPYSPGHDARGYRNPEALDAAEILAIGDSYTYGIGAESRDSWPGHLAELTGRSTYNAGIVGYGFCEYRTVLRHLGELDPEVVVIGVFTGNDLGDTYRSVYQDGRCPGLRSMDADVLEEVRSLDSQRTIAEQAGDLGWEVSSEVNQRSIRSWLSAHSSVYGLLRQLRQLVTEEPLSFASSAALPDRLAWDDVLSIRTVFKSPAMFQLTVDLADPRIREGMRISQEVLSVERDRLREEGTRLLVVLIPEKVTVYAELLRDVGGTTLPEDFFELARLDTNVADEFARFLTEEQIEFVRVAPALVTAVRGGHKVFPEWDDHHNNGAGYQIIAEEIMRVLDSR